MSPAAAYETASAWGSYVNASDPGAVFYTLRPGDGRPDTEAHRAELLEGVADRPAAPHLGAEDRAELASLAAFLARVALAPRRCGVSYALAFAANVAAGLVMAAPFLGAIGAARLAFHLRNRSR